METGVEFGHIHPCVYLRAHLLFFDPCLPNQPPKPLPSHPATHLTCMLSTVYRAPLTWQKTTHGDCLIRLPYSPGRELGKKRADRQTREMSLGGSHRKEKLNQNSGQREMDVCCPEDPWKDATVGLGCDQ